MLFVLTGDIQTGKTRWLEQLIANLQSSGITVYGVIAPGVWADRRGMEEQYEHTDANGFEKLGIDNVLLPSGERIAFARRADLAEQEGSFDKGTQSARAKLGWHISDEALARVNDHFASISTLAAEAGAQSTGLLVIDELGRLELERGEGLTETIRVLDAGPTPLYQHALIVVRQALLPHLEGRFAAWEPSSFIGPDDDPESLTKLW